jgi:sulfur transfer complex TusBCD TusB component (DsrH family)
MAPIRPHEPNAELLAPEDVDSDVITLSQVLLEQKAQRIARNVLVRPDIQEALQQLLATKLYASEEDVIARSLKGLQVAVAAHS